MLYCLKATGKYESHWCRVRTQHLMRVNGILPVGVASSDIRVQEMARDDCLVMFVVRTGSVHVHSSEKINERKQQTDALCVKYALQIQQMKANIMRASEEKKMQGKRRGSKLDPRSNTMAKWPDYRRAYNVTVDVCIDVVGYSVDT